MSIEVLLLGTAQDAGLPQIGCQCVNCAAVRSRELAPDTAASLALINTVENTFWLVDATPDVRIQLELVELTYPNARLVGVILTHAHIGHYAGLMFLGRESMNTRRIPVYASKKMAGFLEQHAPWQQLVSLENIVLHCVEPEVEVDLCDGLKIRASEVPHRAEYSDTLAVSIIGNSKSLFYCPDIDRWQDWNKNVRQVVESHDVNLLDATFFSDQELPGRDMSKIPHPLVTDTVERLKHCQSEVVLIHLNHTNPLYQKPNAQQFVRESGLNIGKLGQKWVL